MSKRVLGVITARGGSKGIPGKNIKSFLGKPLIGWTIEAALKSKVFDPASAGVGRLILSTHDQTIAHVANGFGGAVPFLRPAELAADNTPHIPVMQHAVSWLREKEGYEPDYVMILQPTSPLRQPFHLKEAIEILKKEGADSLVSVSLVPKHFHPDWQFIKDDKNRIKIFTGAPLKNIVTRRQNLSDTFYKNGAIFLFKTRLLFEKEPSIYGNDVLAYQMDEKYSVNIDTPDEWRIAEELVKKI